MAIAAEFPDIDTLWTLRGPVSGFEHHRGITHTFVGVPVEAAFLLSVFVLAHRWRAIGKRAQNTPTVPVLAGLVAPRVPVRWGWLFGCIVLALLSHLLLDYTNNYGIRPFFPFSPHWYAASIVFIFDPYLFFLLLGGLVLPSVFALVGKEMGARREKPRGRGWAVAALAGVALLWSVRAFEHEKALSLANEQSLRAPSREGTPGPMAGSEAASDQPPQELPRTLLRARTTLASPDPFSVFRWYTVTDFGPSYVLSTADTSAGSVAQNQVLTKPQSDPALAAAKQTRLGRIYLDWSTAPFLTENRGLGEEASGNGDVVLFQDLRFAGDIPLLRGRATTPLTGTVVFDSAGNPSMEGMDGKYER